jgi:hypothetical protein
MGNRSRIQSVFYEASIIDRIARNPCILNRCRPDFLLSERRQRCKNAYKPDGEPYFLRRSILIRCDFWRRRPGLRTCRAVPELGKKATAAQMMSAAHIPRWLRRANRDHGGRFHCANHVRGCQKSWRPTIRFMTLEFGIWSNFHVRARSSREQRRRCGILAGRCRACRAGRGSWTH